MARGQFHIPWQDSKPTTGARRVFKHVTGQESALDDATLRQIARQVNRELDRGAPGRCDRMLVLMREAQPVPE